MIEEEISVNSVKAWLLASRPKTLAAAAVPVMVGLSIAWSEMPAAVRLPWCQLCCVCFLPL